MEVETGKQTQWSYVEQTQGSYIVDSTYMLAVGSSRNLGVEGETLSCLAESVLANAEEKANVKAVVVETGISRRNIFVTLNMR